MRWWYGFLPSLPLPLPLEVLYTPRLFWLSEIDIKGAFISVPDPVILKRARLILERVKQQRSDTSKIRLYAHPQQYDFCH